MSCEPWQDAISARADGEDGGIDARLVDAHLARCAPCRAFEARIAGSRGRALLTEAPRMPDLSRRISRMNAMADRASRWGVVRALLAVVAIEVIVLAAPQLLLGDGDGASDAHGVRHLGAFSVAYAIALLVVVVRPARARAVLPVSAFLSAALLVTAVVDLLNGVAPWNGEIAHIPEVLSVILVWMLTVGRDRPAGAARGPSARAVLRGIGRGADRGAVGQRSAGERSA